MTTAASDSRVLTGQVPPEMIRSKDNASGMPAGLKVLPEVKESLKDGLEVMDSLLELT